MSTPIRIQRLRSAGWKQPPSTKYCGRPGKFGNPFRAVQTMKNPDWFVVYVITPGAFAKFCQVIRDQHGPGVFHTKQEAQSHAAFLFGKLMDVAPGQYPVHELAGFKHLSCWCALDTPCHVDEIIKRINHLPDAKKTINK